MNGNAPAIQVLASIIEGASRVWVYERVGDSRAKQYVISENGGRASNEDHQRQGNDPNCAQAHHVRECTMLVPQLKGLAFKLGLYRSSA